MKKTGLLLIIAMLFSVSLAFAQWHIDEGFESGSLPEGWRVRDNNWDGKYWQVYGPTSDAHTGEYVARVWYNYSQNSDDWLITPQCYIQNGDSLIFYAREFWSGYAEDFNVKLSTSGNNVSDFTVTLDEVRGLSSTNYIRYSYDLSNYAGRLVYLAIQCVTPAGQGWYLYVDDLKVGQDPPYAVEVSQITPNASVERGTSYFYRIMIENKGANSDTYIYTANSGSWTTGIYDLDYTTPVNDATIPSFGVDYVFVKVTVPEDVSPGSTDTETFVASGTGVSDNCFITTTAVTFDWGGGGTAEGGYYFANSLSTDAPSHPTYSWYSNQTGGANEGTLIDATDFVNGNLDDGHTDPINIFDDGSAFNFFGNDYTQMYLSTNGTIGFGDIASAWHISSYYDVPNADSYNNMIAWCWDNLNYDTTVSNIRISRLTDKTVVTFWHYPTVEGSCYITAQVILYKDGRIFIMYNDDESTYNQTIQNCVIGIENADGTAGVKYRYEQTGGPMFGSNLALAFGKNSNTLPVELSTFTARYLSDEQSVSLYWRTESETDNIGWYVYRNSANDFEHAKKLNNDLILGYGTTSEPHNYTFEDRIENASAGDEYWYWIESRDLTGKPHTYDPLSVVISPAPDEPDTPSEPILRYGLHQNKPNPLVQGEVKIGFCLPQTSNVKLNVYNIRGELVKQLYSGTTAEYEVKWDGKDAHGTLQPTGIYLYQLQVNGKVYETKKMIIMR